MKFEAYALSKYKVVGSAGGLVLILLLIAFAMHFLQRHFVPSVRNEPVPSAESPRDQVEFESGVLQKRFRAQQEAELKRYSWTDDKRDFARIPLARTMQLLADQRHQRHGEPK